MYYAQGKFEYYQFDYHPEKVRLKRVDLAENEVMIESLLIADKECETLSKLEKITD